MWSFNVQDSFEKAEYQAGYDQQPMTENAKRQCRYSLFWAIKWFEIGCKDPTLQFIDRAIKELRRD
jgi:hypothetical protein